MKGCPLKYLLDLNDSGTWGQDPTGEDDVPVLRSTDIRLDGSWRIHDPALRQVTGPDKVRKRLAPGDIVVVKSSGSPEHLGKSAIVTEEVAGMKPYFANFVQRLRPSVSTDSRYIWYVLNSKRAADEMARLGNTTTGLRNLNAETIGSISIPVIRLAEQRTIANYLDTETNRIDTLITKKHRMIGLLEEHRHGIITSAVWGDREPRDVRPRNQTPGWSHLRNRTTETAALRHFITCLDGRRVPLNSSERAEIPGEYPYWGANGVVDTVGEYLFHEELVLLGEDGAPFDEPLRNVAFHIRIPVWVNNHIHVLKPNARANPRFLTYALNSVDWMPMVSGSTRYKLTQDAMMRARIPCLPLGTQRAIADDLDIETSRIDALVAKQRRMIELLDERRQALITAMVTGELAVPAHQG